MEDDKQQMMARALQEQASIMYAFAKNSHACYLKCVGKPSSSLSSTEDACLTNCVERYGDVQLFLIERLQGLAEKEKEKGGMSLS